MPPVARRAAPAAPAGVNFGDLNFYTGGGFNLPEGDYALEFDARFHAFTKKDGTKGQENLGIMVLAHPVNRETGERTGETLDQFYSLGKKAKDSFMPDPNTGKGLVPVPNAASSTLPRLTNWNVFLKSLYDSGLPQGVFANDLSVLDGVWVHTQNQPAPEERKSFGGKTGEAGQEADDRGPDMISVVTEIIASPWEGEGGIPADEVAAAPAAKVAPKAAVKPGPAAKPPVAAKKPAAAPPAEEPAEDGEDIKAAAMAGFTTVLEANPAGCTKLLLRTGTFKAVTAAYGDDMAQAVTEQFLNDQAAMTQLLGELGFKLVGANIKPA